jgi:murein DD-endopeptidase MepM/ murein hydrolase activator NlpD
VTDLVRWGSLSFPEKQWFWRRASSGLEFASAHPKSVALGAAAAIGVAASTYFASFYIRYEQLAAAEQAAVMHAERANADLQDALARLRDQVAAADQALNTAQSRIAELSDETKKQLAVSEQVVTSKADRIGQLTRALEQAQRELHLTEAQRVTLLARLSKADVDLTEEQARQHEAQAGLDQWQKKIQQLTADRDKAASERDHLRARVGELEQKHSMMQAPAPVAEARPEPTATAPAAAAAVAPAAPVARAEPVRPTPAPRGQHPASSLSPEKLAALYALVKALPVSAPLESYDIGSPFGVRGDPINGHSSFHTGIDLRAPYMTPVYATAAGVVTYSGYRDDYGKIVEIDHGNGISTRYAHLHRQTVSVGQRVAAHSEIGLLGSTGRATGPHVHYEVLVNGEPQDPEKFLGLAHLVSAVQR